MGSSVLPLGPALYPKILPFAGLFVVHTAARKPLGDNGYSVKLGRMGDQVPLSTVDGSSRGLGGDREGAHAAFLDITWCINCSPMYSVYAGGMAWRPSNFDIHVQPIASAKARSSLCSNGISLLRCAHRGVS